MTLTIDLTPEEEARLDAAADSESLEPAALIREWINSLPGRNEGTDGIRQDDAYALPKETLAAYQALLDKKFTAGLTSDEEQRLAALAAELGAADLAIPLESQSDTEAEREHQHRITTLDSVIEMLRNIVH